MRSVAAAIREHFQNFNKWLPLNLIVELSDRTISINSLLFQTASPYWSNYIRTNCLEKGKKSFSFTNAPYADFSILREYAYKGKVKELHLLDEKDILRILHLARGCEFKELEDESEELMLRYITPENLFEYIEISENNSLIRVKKRCCELFNSFQGGVVLFPLNIEQLALELEVSSEFSLEQFSKWTPYVTHFIAGERVMEDSAVITLLQHCPRLISMDLGRMRVFSENIYLLQHLTELIFAGSFVLDDVYFKKICINFPSLQKLNLTSCSRITLVSWGELTKLTRLITLNLSRCEFLSQEEFSLILLSARQLRELTISECRSLNNTAFHALATCQQQFVSLDLGRTSIEDQELLEIVKRITSLSHLNLTRCQNLSDQGIVNALKISSLQEVILTHTNISAGAIEELNKQKPSLKIEV